MNSRLSLYIFNFMLQKGIISSQSFSDEVGVGRPWLRSFLASKGNGNSTIVPLELLHDCLVSNYGMSSVISIPYIKEQDDNLDEVA